jgi:diaminopimelate decarboxylase
MSPDTAFTYRNGALFCEEVSLADIASRFGTPAYIYSRAAIATRFSAYRRLLEGVPHRVCFAVKANSNIAILQLLASLGAGFDIVSGGELFRVLQAGADPASVVFSGVGKTRDEIDFALSHGIHSFNCESADEVSLLAEIAARRDTTASVALRVNPDVDADTHPYISTGLKEHKFGIDISVVGSVYRQMAQFPHLTPNGVSCHIGSQLLAVEPLLEAAGKMIALVANLRAAGFPIRHLDLGGGLGVPYRPTDKAAPVEEFITFLRPMLLSTDIELVLEPGRSVVAEAGILLSQVLFEKQNGSKTFVIVDAGMNDLIRPALYGAHHEITPVQESDAPLRVADIVGPVCETGDFFARSREIAPLSPGSLIAIRTVGAYGFVLASNYNSRPRPVEIMVNGADVRVIRRRESYHDLIRGEQLL